MIGVGAPGFLLAGGLVALAVVALHLLVRLPPNRVPLPTARFLTATPRASVRVRRTPQDVLLLALRVLFALTFAAAFARPVWRAERDDVAHIVMLDRGAGMAGVWSAAVDSARVRAHAALLLFDTAAVWVRAPAAAFFDSLRAAGPAAAEADYRAAFRALASAGRVIPAGAYRATLISVPRWGAWRAGTATARRAAWPGSLALVPLSADVAGTSAPHAVQVAAPTGSALRDAVAALGWEAVDTFAAGTNVVRLAYASGGVRADAVSVDVIFRGGWAAPAVRDDVQPPQEGRNPHAVAAWRDGTVAALATADSSGCIVTTSFTIDAGPVIASPDYPELVRRLVEPCLSSSSMAPLDSGGMALLRGAGTADVAVAALPDGAPGRPLGRPLLAIALLLALAEWPLRQRRTRERLA